MTKLLHICVIFRIEITPMYMYVCMDPVKILHVCMDPVKIL